MRISAWSCTLQRRFGAQLVDSESEADQIMNVFYNSLATDQSDFGFSIPLGFIPGLGPSAKINIITLEKYHGISEMYYFIGPSGVEHRSATLQAIVRTDALGLPFITIPFSEPGSCGIVSEDFLPPVIGTVRSGKFIGVMTLDTYSFGLSTHHTDSILFTTGGIGIYARPASQFQLIHGSTSDSHAKPAR